MNKTVFIVVLKPLSRFATFSQKEYEYENISDDDILSFYIYYIIITEYLNRSSLHCVLISTD